MVCGPGCLSSVNEPPSCSMILNSSDVSAVWCESTVMSSHCLRVPSPGAAAGLEQPVIPGDGGGQGPGVPLFRSHRNQSCFGGFSARPPDKEPLARRKKRSRSAAALPPLGLCPLAPSF